MCSGCCFEGFLEPFLALFGFFEWVVFEFDFLRFEIILAVFLPMSFFLVRLASARLYSFLLKLLFLIILEIFLLFLSFTLNHPNAVFYNFLNYFELSRPRITPRIPSEIFESGLKVRN